MSRLLITVDLFSYDIGYYHKEQFDQMLLKLAISKTLTRTVDAGPRPWTLDPDPGPRPWTRTLDPDPGPWT